MPDREEFEEGHIRFKYNDTLLVGAHINIKGEDFCETNISAIWGFWQQETYERQWREGLKRIRTHNSSCLVLSVQDPLKFRLVNTWMLYKINNKIHIRNRLFIGRIYEEVIGNRIVTPENCYDILIEPREVLYADSDETPQEWVVTL